MCFKKQEHMLSGAKVVFPEECGFCFVTLIIDPFSHVSCAHK